MNKDNRLIIEAYLKGNEEEINVQKADLNKDHKLNDYELARAKAIDKAQGGSGEMSNDEEAETKINHHKMVGLVVKLQLTEVIEAIFNAIEAIEKVGDIPYSQTIESHCANLEEEANRLVDLVESKMGTLKGPEEIAIKPPVTLQ